MFLVLLNLLVHNDDLQVVSLPHSLQGLHALRQRVHSGDHRLQVDLPGRHKVDGDLETTRSVSHGPNHVDLFGDDEERGEGVDRSSQTSLDI